MIRKKLKILKTSWLFSFQILVNRILGTWIEIFLGCIKVFFCCICASFLLFFLFILKVHQLCVLNLFSIFNMWYFPHLFVFFSSMFWMHICPSTNHLLSLPWMYFLLIHLDFLHDRRNCIIFVFFQPFLNQARDFFRPRFECSVCFCPALVFVAANRAFLVAACRLLTAEDPLVAEHGL